MNEALFKIIAAFILWLIIMLFGLLPIKSTKFQSNPTLLSLSNCFSGGLFVAIGLIHILPEAHADLEGQREQKQLKANEEVFPLYYILCLATFSFILFIDTVLFNNNDVVEDLDEDLINLKKSAIRRDHTEEEFHPNTEENFKERVSNKYKLAMNLSGKRKHKDAHKHFPHGKIKGDFKYAKLPNCEHEDDPECAKIAPLMLDENDNTKKFRSVKTFKEGSERPNKKTVRVVSPDEMSVSENSIEKIILEEKPIKKHTHHVHSSNHHHHHSISEDDSFKAYIIIIAMGIHGIFAGLAFGVTKSNSQMIDMFLAMLFHKWSEALTVGVSLVSAKVPTRKAAFLIFLLSIFTPVGIFLGYLISDMSKNVTGVCKAMSAGTFIYISCAEIIVEEFSISKNKFAKFLFYLLGIAFIVAIGFIE
jgi:zinc transporter 1/2/3